MASGSTQAKAQELSARLQGEASSVLDSVDKVSLRKIAKQTHVCIVKCFDQAGTTGSGEALEQCSHACQVPQQRANNIIQSEVSSFQSRVDRSMADCQDKARDLMVPGYEKDARKMAKVENAFLECMSKNVNEHIKLLRPMKERIVAKLENME